MQELVFLLLGVILGAIVTTILSRSKTGYGFFRLEKIPDEEDLYTINMRLIPDQKLNEKKRIILTRE